MTITSVNSELISLEDNKLDAIKLANLLRGGYIAKCYLPDRRIMDLRELVRHRAALVRMRTKLKNKIHSIVLMKGIQISVSITHLHIYIMRNSEH